MDKVSFKNSGLRYGGFTYSFPIKTDRLEFQSEIKYLKTNWLTFEHLNIRVELTGDEDFYEGVMRVTTGDGFSVQKEITYGEENNNYIQLGP